MAKYLTLTGLKKFYDGFKSRLLTQDNYDQIDAAYKHSQADHAPADAEKNTVVSVKVNGQALVADGDRAVDVSVPTGALADKDEVAETELATALADKINGKADSATTVAGYGITDAYTKDEVNGIKSNLESLVASATAGKVVITLVDALPAVEDASADTIYLVPKVYVKGDNETDEQFEARKSQNAKDEYMFINGAFEKVGDTAIDLTSYVKVEDMPTAITDEEIESIFTA